VLFLPTSTFSNLFGTAARLYLRSKSSLTSRRQYQCLDLECLASRILRNKFLFFINDPVSGLFIAPQIHQDSDKLRHYKIKKEQKFYSEKLVFLPLGNLYC
jgi:hypothetical protein